MPLARPRTPAPELSWCGWGDPARAAPLPEGLHALLRDALGVRDSRPVPSSMRQIELVAVRLPESAGAELTAVVGERYARDDHEVRVRHSLGRSTIDLLELRSGRPLDAPDLVLTPGSHEEILELLAICSDRGVAVVPFGGGTSVVGGLTPESAGFAGTVALDMKRLNALRAVDEESRLAVLEPGLRGPEAEALLGERGYTIGHFPQSFEYATLGGFAAARSSGQASAGYGRFDELVLALKLATPAGTLELGRAPRSAAGPDLRQLVLGSEGALGVITELTVQIQPTPAARIYEGWRLESFAHGAATLRRLIQDGRPPTVLRLSDEAETALGPARPDQVGAVGAADAAARGAGATDAGADPVSGAAAPAPAAPGAAAGGGCLAIIGYEGTAEDVESRRGAATRTLREAGAEPVDGAGEGWAHERYRGPYLRDSLLAAGALVETLETVTFWSSLPGLYTAVGGALRESLTDQGTPPVILCHVSHVYPAGASLYFTIACAQLPDPVSQWRRAKAAAGDAILAAGGSITHHHGVGRDHRPWYERELGPLGVAVVQAAKATLDPAGILNPGILVPGANG
jgi:alkyldihydroxyacetonephosphate synthase